jgi:hypothetical protein
MRGIIAAAALAVPVVALSAQPASACGGLVGENGTIQLVRTTTLAAYTGGIERYITAFEFTGEGKEVGTIVPLPDVPTEVTRAGDWTLQRLVREVQPVEEFSAERALSADAAAPGAQVILQTQIDALDITVLKGGGDAVGEWAVDHGFLLTPDAPEVLDYYAERSPVFMAARFNAERAKQLGQGAGDSTPIMATIPTDDPWVPIHILGLGADEDTGNIQADVFLLTDDRPQLMAGGTGLTLDRSEAASGLLLSDLRSDVNMDWIPDEMWLSYLTLDSPAAELDYDLAVSTTPGVRPSLVDAGVNRPEALPVLPDGAGGIALWPLFLGAGAGLAVIAIGWRRHLHAAGRPA